MVVNMLIFHLIINYINVHYQLSWKVKDFWISTTRVFFTNYSRNSI